MKDVEQRRIIPVSMITLVLFVTLLLFQVVMMAGGMEVRSSVILKVAPWAYKPFLRLVGEDPESMAARERREPEEKKSSSAIAAMAELNASADVGHLLDVPLTNSVAGPVDPDEPAEEQPEPNQPEDVPAAPEQPAVVDPEDVEPVG